ncbi:MULTISPECIES: GuaB3 family IMP dehydrogenase-related protein [unclassified Corynebacterium]|uniref:GuaB3 family IMP dehydrogenase-related protein n=1 Tax=unclassified Corynebacterium TaxID=2624378 RepID=UPI001EF50820|nr:MULTISPECIES: GuaB3 family IMP dehydrogenase-related protein [unclassified Corynebacterium]MCG7242924.1 GuaB3 family IMP dehydrogenase-related protein [Corynebacterium sp. ACRPS]MCG7272140.1 GuaB3 family IMP dehydrogenase-related protein [Corynebacterium sp. ACRQM]MCG7234247.1 GuaB3 family IMP dehydrogenase-related protein [Corynebacterium sp. ACRPR]MDK8473557.1 GuaB3 family IMP dehydrogenase-related protein [Corynebacterium sp. MSK078]MDK8659379.1 GuaB3 family IMP dehydrogenase-related pro
MREYAEIGIGREARRTFDLDQVSIVPQRRTRSSKDVDTTWNIDAYTFDTPFVSHPTDALATPEFVIEMGQQGGLGVINAEGLWGRHEDLEGALARIYSQPGDNSTIQELHAAPLDDALLASRIAQVRESGVTVAVRVSPQNAREMAPKAIAAGAELLFIQGTLLSAEHVATGGEPLNLKEFIGSLEVPVIAGGVADYTTALHLMRTGAAGVIVGAGVTTNAETVGIDTAMATAIADAAAARRDYLDETEGRYVHIIADAEFDNSGTIAKAFACGADSVALGPLLAQAREAGGRGWYWPATAGHPRFPRGYAQFAGVDTDLDVDFLTAGDAAPAAAPSLETVLHGPSSEPFGRTNLVGALRRALAKCGYTDLKSFQKVELAVRY